MNPSWCLGARQTPSGLCRVRVTLDTPGPSHSYILGVPCLHRPAQHFFLTPNVIVEIEAPWNGESHQ